MTSRRPSLVRFAWLSIGAALTTIALKTGAWWMTGSVGLLSDALESLVNLAAACVALMVLVIAARPADEEYPYGYDKAEYFSSGMEGGMILLAALAIIATAADRLLHPQPLEQLGIGLAMSVAASLVNFAIARVLLTAGRRHRSITLEADAHHLMTDVWTSGGVLVGLGAVMLTGWHWLDPVIAIAVAVHIVWIGIRLLRGSARGLMDASLPPADQKLVRDALERHRVGGVEYHALRTRSAASRRFVSVHVLVPGGWTVQRGHDLLERIEADVRGVLPGVTILTHLEPLEDPASFQDAQLDRE